MAGALAGLALCSRGPLGLVRVVGRRAHQVIDLAILAGLAALPVLVASGRSVTSALVAEVGAVALARLDWATRYAAPSTHHVAPQGRAARDGQTP